MTRLHWSVTVLVLIVLLAAVEVTSWLKRSPESIVNTRGVGRESSIQTISECLSGDRPDMAVSLWLQDKAAKADVKSLPKEVVAAYRVDRLLAEVNSGGFLGFFNWEREIVPETAADLREIGLDDTAKALEAAMHLLSPGHWPASDEEYYPAREAFIDDSKRSDLMDRLDNFVIGQSKRIEDATHEYIRKHLSTFQALDK